jgi:3-oxoacyl-[acyl-carrier protein] reductase
VVSIGSRVWLGGGATGSYSASKAGLVGLTREACRELGPLGVTVNVVAPSFVRTPLNAEKGDAGFVEAYARRFAAASPLGRLVEPADIAGAVAFLLSDRARAITGEVLHVTAGTHLAPFIP